MKLDSRRSRVVNETAALEEEIVVEKMFQDHREILK